MKSSLHTTSVNQTLKIVGLDLAGCVQSIVAQLRAINTLNTKVISTSPFINLEALHD